MEGDLSYSINPVYPIVYCLSLGLMDSKSNFLILLLSKKSLEQKEKTTRNKVSVVSRCTYIKMSDVKKKLKN